MEPIFSDFGTTVVFSSQLDGSIGSQDTSILLDNANDFPSKGSVTIDSEVIVYTGKSGHYLTGCIRGADSTSHTSNTVVNTNPRVSQSPLSTDRGKAGWYVDRFHNDKVLRLSESDIALAGVVKLNKSRNVFQGFNGEEWVDFNATQGEAGADGASGISLIEASNLPIGLTVEGEIYAGKDDDTLNFRSLRSGTVDINATITDIDAIDISKSDDYITLTPAPRPYVWDFSSNNTITYLKSNTSDSLFKAFGEISIWKVRSGKTITAGTAVRIALSVSNTGYTNSTTEIVIEPYTYSASQEEIKQGSAVLGIALESKTAGQSCRVCTSGITTVLIGDGNGAGNQTSNVIDGPGAFGFIGYDAKVYNESLSTGINSNTPVIGYWLERGTFTIGTAVLFHVKSGFSMT
jgi:hypothetical protein